VRWALGGSSLVGALLLLYCATPTKRELAPPPRMVPLAASNLPQRVPSVAPAAPTAELDGARFAPLLARPGFEAVTRALEDGDDRRAALEFERATLAHPPAVADAASFAFLGATLAERSSNPVGALAAYARANQPDYVLSAYARAGRVRALLLLGKNREALTEAVALPELPPLMGKRRLLVAEASFKSGDRAGALAALRAELNAPSAGTDKSEVALRLADALATGSKPDDQELVEAVALARRAAADAAARPELSSRARTLTELALSLMSDAERTRNATASVSEELALLEGLVEARRFNDALGAAARLQPRISSSGKANDVPCRLTLARAKAHAGVRERPKASEVMTQGLVSCESHPQLHARALFNAAKYAAAEGRYSDAANLYARVESEHPTETLADDARLQAALAYLELGVEARFTSLLTSMPEDFPSGDMVVEGLFRLAVRRMDKLDWSGAASVLQRAVERVGDEATDAARGSELSGRERYFQARAELALGQRERALVALETIVEQFPLSYYMLHAYGRLREIDASRADRARTVALERSQAASRPRFSAQLLTDHGFLRALELLRVGEETLAVAELDVLGLTRPGAEPELLWAVAQTYSRAGAEKLAHDVARRRLSDWLLRWPAGDWLAAWRVAYPEPYKPLVEAAAKRAGLEQAIVYAIMREESAFEPGAESSADAHGLMQLIPPTAKAAAKGTNLPSDRRALKRPSVNIELGCRTLARYMKAFPDNSLLGIPAYNAGPGKVRDWLAARPSTDFDLWVELIPYLETRRYTKRVLASRAAYSFLYDATAGERALVLPSRVKG
jgi:soluble lytic murein transglycosylase